MSTHVLRFNISKDEQYRRCTCRVIWGAVFLYHRNIKCFSMFQRNQYHFSSMPTHPSIWCWEDKNLIYSNVMAMKSHGFGYKVDVQFAHTFVCSTCIICVSVFVSIAVSCLVLLVNRLWWDLINVWLVWHVCACNAHNRCRHLHAIENNQFSE